ncbi:MAG: bifunctional heptose 7-phosphate kinase/heptose 1-phosphate adenyltransferase [Chitinophagaceae bacterium]|jgi:rfaE bifunctional protein kinase chain/domain
MMEHMDFMNLFGRFRQIKALVIGDVMLDAYLWGRVDRISPEAPVPVVQLTRKDHRIGGAGNVGLNLAALGASVSMLSVTGADEESAILRRMFRDGGIASDDMIEVEGRVTTTKTRVISRNQQMLRIDNEVTDPIDADTEGRLLELVTRRLEIDRPDVLIFEDYDKGVLTETLIRAVTDQCRSLGVITAVDPKRRNFFSYAGVDVFKPNLKEVREGLMLESDPVSLPALIEADRRLRERLGHVFSFITLSDRGVFHADGRHAELIPSHMRNIADVSGAGDTVIAVAALAFAATQDMGLSARMANIAGGLVCEEVGTVAINPDRLLQECIRLLN